MQERRHYFESKIFRTKKLDNAKKDSAVSLFENSREGPRLLRQAKTSDLTDIALWSGQERIFKLFLQICLNIVVKILWIQLVGLSTNKCTVCVFGGGATEPTAEYAIPSHSLKVKKLLLEVFLLYQKDTALQRTRPIRHR